MRSVIVSTGKYHINSIISDLQKEGYKEVYVISGSPRFNQDIKHVWIPLPFQIIFRKILKIQQPAVLKVIDFVLLDFVASLYVRRKTLLIGFAGVSLRSGMLALKKGGQYILDRACPYLPFQLEHNALESERCGLNPPGISRFLLKRCLMEYETSSRINVPSLYSLKSYPQEYIRKLKLYRLDVKPLKTVECNREENSFVIGIVATNFVRKGLRTGFQILERILEDDKAIKLNLKMTKGLCLSTESARNFYSRYADRIFFTGYVNDIAEYYSAIDILMVPSNDEGFGMVVFEALQVGVPVVLSEYVGAGDYINSSHYSSIIKNDEVEKNVDSMKKLIDKLKVSDPSDINADCQALYQGYIDQKLSYV